MTESISLDALRPFKRGDYIKRPVINALIEAARARGIPPGRGDFNDGSGPVRRRQGHSRDALSWFRCESEVDAPPFSVVEVYDARLDPDGIVFIVREVSTVSSNTVLAGNENYELINGSGGWVKMLTPYEPVLINVSAYSLPVVFNDKLTVTGLDIKVDGAGSLIALAAEHVLGSSDTGSGLGTGPGSKTAVPVIMPSGSGAETCRTVRFRIGAPITGTMSAICFIHAVDAGFILDDVPDLASLEFAGNPFPGTPNIIVCDPMCMFFNEPTAGLTNRLGWARYMQPLIPNSCQPNYDYLLPQWEVFALNCVMNPEC